MKHVKIHGFPLSACLVIGVAEQIICIFRWVPLVCVAERIKRFRGGCVLREEVFADGLKVIAFSDWPNPLPGSWITQVKLWTKASEIVAKCVLRLHRHGRIACTPFSYRGQQSDPASLSLGPFW